MTPLVQLAIRVIVANVVAFGPVLGSLVARLLLGALLANTRAHREDT